MKSHRNIIVLFEDKGAADFFEQLRSALGLENITFTVGSGWTQTYTRYEEIVKGNEAEYIVPVLDADTITDKPPQARSILRNPNLFRFSVDFEWTFDEWMLTDVIANFLKEFNAPLSIADPAILVSLDKVVQSARPEAWKTKTPIYSILKDKLAQWLTAYVEHPAAFPLPEKAWLASKLGERLAALQVLPRELDLLARRIQEVAGVVKSESHEHTVWLMNANRVVESTIQDLGLYGNILLTINGRLHILRLSQGSLTPFGLDEQIYSASWSPDYSTIAAQMIRHRSGTKTYHLAIISNDGVVLSEISQGIPSGGATQPCWHPSGKSLLVKVNGPVLSVTVDGERWLDRLDEDTGMFCQAADRCCARTVQNERYSLELGKSWDALSRVEGVNDVRGHINWSHVGSQLAFTEYHLSNDRGCVAIIKKQDLHPRVITPLAWSPYWVTWSPDDRFVAFSCLAEHGDRSLYVVEVNSGEVRCLLHLSSEIVMGCRAWGP